MASQATVLDPAGRTGVRLAFDEMPEQFAGPAAIAPNATTTTSGAINNEIENSNGHGENSTDISMANSIGGGGRTSGSGPSGSGQDTMEHSSKRFFLVDSTKDDFEFLWKLRKYLVLLGILAVGVTYNSGLTPPGGFWNNIKDGHEAGDPALRVEFFQRSIKPESSHGSNGKDSTHESVAPAEDSACELKFQTTGNQQASSTTEVESSLEYPPEGNQNNANIESLLNCQHPSDNSPQSTNSEDLLSDLECESTDCKLVGNSMESLSSTEHPSSSCQQRDGMSADSQPVSGTKEQSSADNIRANDISQEGSSEQNMSAGDTIDDGRLSLPVEASGNVESTKEHTFGYTNGDIENGGVNNSAEHENGHIDHNKEEKDQNYHGDSTEEHLDKTRTYLLLLAILAVSLTYQSGLNPPGGFWSRNENNHSAGDRILEDSDHPRFIAFFYLNAVAFVSSIVIILMLLNKSMSKKQFM
nr:unnamed protein product [Digitaria exilis]